jgi:hypothetical protein
MKGLTDFITKASWDDIALVLYVQVDDAYRLLVAALGAPRQRGEAPQVSDSEVITCVLLCELLFRGDEERFCHFWHQQLRHLFPQTLDRSQFNRRRRALTLALEYIRRLWRDTLLPSGEEVRLIDSAPVPVCTYARSNRCQTVRGAEYCGRVVSKKMRFFGFRLHATVTPDQLIDEWLLAPAAMHDSQAVTDLLGEEAEITVIGDAAYGCAAREELLWEEAMIQLLPLRKSNEQRQWTAEIRQLLNRARMRVETAFSQLTVVFDFGLTGARSLLGVVNRVASKILAHTFCFLWWRVCWMLY